ncbi:MAG: hypothetical protein ACJ71D_08585 [Nitrososphaera sp.]
MESPTVTLWRFAGGRSKVKKQSVQYCMRREDSIKVSLVAHTRPPEIFRKAGAEYKYE